MCPLDLPKFYKACNPSKTLNIQNPEDRKYYIDFSSVRGARIIEQIERTITDLSPDEPTCQLFTGHIGCGKSTELLRLKYFLEEQNFHVVYFEATEDIDIGNVDISDILLSITRHVIESLEKLGIKFQPNYFQRIFQDIQRILTTEVDITDVEFSVGIATITTQIKGSSNERNKLRSILEPRTASLIDSINGEILEPAIDRLAAQGRKGLVIIVDNLDRIDNTIKPSGSSQPEYLFVDRGEQLRRLKCHVVYSIPLILTFANQLLPLQERFGSYIKVLPMVKVKTRDGQLFEEGINLLRQMMLARAFPDLEEQERLNLVTAVFDSPETLDRLCLISGGHVRNLLVILYSCLQQKNPPISRKCLEGVIRRQRNMLRRAITFDEWNLLAEVKQNPWISGEEEYQTLISSLFVFEYEEDDEDEEGTWFDVNPILGEAKELTSIINRP